MPITIRHRFSRWPFPLQHFVFDLISQHSQMPRKAVKKIPLGFIGREIADQGAFRRIYPQLLQMLLVVLHPIAPMPLLPGSIHTWITHWN
jgi:hypothetical protein